MSEREEALNARVRETPLVERLQDCAKRIGAMCSDGRGPRMSIPPEHYDDDFYICVTVEDARERIAAIDSQLAEADNARKHAQEVGSKLVEEVRAQRVVPVVEVRAQRASKPPPWRSHPRWLSLDTTSLWRA